MSEFILQTAILSGDHTLELRVFSTVDISVATEIKLTQKLCSAMNQYQRHWEEWVSSLIFAIQAAYSIYNCLA